MADEYYDLLEVSSNATEDEIKQAYRRLARELHPDANRGDGSTEERFKAINQAYETLRDPERRRQYDMFGAEPRGGGASTGDPFGFGGAGAGGLGDLFDNLFGGGGGASPFGASGGRGGRAGPRGGEDAEAVIDLEFAEAVFGADHTLDVRLPQSCPTCEGSGARPGTSAVTCSTCNGIGEVRRVRQSILGQMVTAGPCPNCGGTGQQIPTPCQDCSGQGRRVQSRSLTVEVPAGVSEGATLRVPGRGAAGPRGGPAGDLYVHLRVKAHSALTRQDDRLLALVHVAFTQAALGTEVDLESLDGVERLAVPPGTQSGKEIRLRGKGVPHLHGRGRGDLVATVVVDTPTDLSREADELLRSLAAERGEEVTPPDPGLMSKIRGAFK
ncbi:MAG: molecular chaperone DnaJ [Actinomycetota bacterium]|nr:molecular chaperone DnaJ [Actinomycetota bacterium]